MMSNAAPAPGVSFIQKFVFNFLHQVIAVYWELITEVFDPPQRKVWVPLKLDFAYFVACLIKHMTGPARVFYSTVHHNCLNIQYNVSISSIKYTLCLETWRQVAGF